MAMHAEFIRPASPLWERLLSGINHDFYHLPRYVSLSVREEGGEPYAFVAEQVRQQVHGPPDHPAHRPGHRG